MTTDFDAEDLKILRGAAGFMSGRGIHVDRILNIADRLESMTTNPNFNTRGPRAGSFNAQVIELNPGECVSKVREVDPTITVARLPFEMPEIRQQARNAVAPAVSRAKQITGGTYTVESGDVVMGNGSMYVVVVVKRVE